MKIRHITEDDVEKFLNLSKRLDKETKFMLFEPNERTTTVDEKYKQIQMVLSSDNQIIFVADNNGELVGFLGASGMKAQRKRHSVYIVIGILQDFVGQGIGTRLFTELEHWAKEKGITRLELTVMVHNDRAIDLYKKMGFEIEGTKRHSLVIEEVFIDEYYMAKLL